MILDLFKYSEQTDDEVGAVHDETKHDEADQRELAVADRISDLPNVWRIEWWSGQLTVPRDVASGCAWYGGSEIVVEAERQGCRPSANETHFQQGMGKLPGSTPQSQWSTEILYLGDRQRRGQVKFWKSLSYIDGNHDMNKCQRRKDDHERSARHLGDWGQARDFKFRTMTHGELPTAPITLYSVSHSLIRIATAKAEVVNVMFTNLKSYGRCHFRVQTGEDKTTNAPGAHKCLTE